MNDVTQTVVQSNLFLENKPRMSLDETRLFLQIVAQFDEKKPDFEWYDISVVSFAEFWGVSLDSAYTQFKNAFRSLLKKDFYTERLTENDKKKFQAGVFITNVEYTEGETHAKVEINHRLKPFFLELKKTYTRYVLENVMNLNQKHSIRLYELLKQYQSIGKRSFSSEQLRSFLYLGDKYKSNNYNFRKIALDPAVEEISRETDLNVTLSIKGRGANAVFEFRIQSKEEAIPVVSPDMDVKKNDLIDFVSAVVAANDIQSTGEKYLEWLESRISHLQVDNRYAYLRKCSTNAVNILEYQAEIEMRQERSAKREENEQIRGQIELQLAQEQNAKLEEYLRDIPEFILAMPEGAKKVQMINAWKSSPKLKDGEENEEVIPAWVEELGPLPKIRDTLEDLKLSPKKPYVMDPDIKIVNFRDDDED